MSRFTRINMRLGMRIPKLIDDWDLPEFIQKRFMNSSELWVILEFTIIFLMLSLLQFLETTVNDDECRRNEQCRLVSIFFVITDLAFGCPCCTFSGSNSDIFI